jgi:hypothetical protein
VVVGKTVDIASAAKLLGDLALEKISPPIDNPWSAGFIDTSRISITASTIHPGHRSVPDVLAVHALIARFSRAISRATAIADEASIFKALERPTDIGAVIDFLRSLTPFLAAEEEIDPQLEDNIGSLEAEEALIRMAGGLKDAKWVAEYLSIAPKSVAAKARRNELLGISRGDRNFYPAFQFRDGKVIPGLRELLEMLPITNGWSRLSFLLTKDPGLDDRSPIEAFATDPEAALEVASSFGVQGAP